MVRYQLKFNDGEHIMYTKSLKEATDYRAKHNFLYISRSIHIYGIYSSRNTGCKLCINPLIVKIV